jgi:hypothetical protein
MTRDGDRAVKDLGEEFGIERVPRLGEGDDATLTEDRQATAASASRSTCRTVSCETPTSAPISRSVRPWDASMHTRARRSGSTFDGRGASSASRPEAPVLRRLGIVRTIQSAEGEIRGKSVLARDESPFGPPLAHPRLDNGAHHPPPRTGSIIGLGAPGSQTPSRHIGGAWQGRDRSSYLSVHLANRLDRPTGTQLPPHRRSGCSDVQRA